MANLFSDTFEFTGYKSVSELTELTFEADKKYTVQAIVPNNAVYIREGETGTGFIKYDTLPFTWECDGVNDLYIGNKNGNCVIINVSE